MSVRRQGLIGGLFPVRQSLNGWGCDVRRCFPGERDLMQDPEVGKGRNCVWSCGPLVGNTSGWGTAGVS